MERLGENPSKYFIDVILPEDRRILDLKEELKNLLHDESNEGDKKAKEFIDKLDLDKAFSTPENQQFILTKRATIASRLDDPSTMHNYAYQALLITRPNFDEHKISSYILSLDELWLINQIAVAYILMGVIEKAADIFIALKMLIEKRFVEGDDLINIYSSVIYNLSKCFGILEKYEECIDVCLIGLDWCKRHRNSYHYPLLLSTKALCLLHIGKLDEGKDVLKKSYALFMGFERYEELQLTINYVENEFGIEINSLEVKIT